MTSTAANDATRQLAQHVSAHLDVETSTRVRVDVDALLNEYQRLVDLAATTTAPMPTPRYVTVIKPDGSEVLVDPYVADPDELRVALMVAACQWTALHKVSAEAAMRFLALRRILDATEGSDHQ